MKTSIGAFAVCATGMLFVVANHTVTYRSYQGWAYDSLIAGRIRWPVETLIFIVWFAILYGATRLFKTVAEKPENATLGAGLFALALFGSLLAFSPFLDYRLVFSGDRDKLARHLQTLRD